ncbi:MAG TPA: YggS family pyridoxal phosphate-dependent enzyme [Gammaproteobacteria bacterium]|nr:YggS family pyridoxal phosphate-dependent enzyme [Gammaproteobacteria bacterium]
MDATETIQDRLTSIRARITRAEREFGRAPGSVQLLAVSKTVPVKQVHDAFLCGQRQFGENYLQEAMSKMTDPMLARAGLEWHFIGTLQSNKTHKIAHYFNWVHTIDRLSIAQRLNDQRPAQLPPLNICLQVNSSGEASKGGVDMEHLPSLAAAVARLPRLRLRGLMTIPQATTDFDQQRLPLRRVREAWERLRDSGLPLDTLSMGMSDDLEAAIAEGATLVRIGTAIFGKRVKSP